MTLTAPRHGVTWLVAAGIAWGTSGTIGTLLHVTSGLSFYAIAGYRIGLGGMLLALGVLLTRTGRLPRTRAGWRRVLIMGLASAVYQFGFFASMSYVGVAVATLVTIGGTAPIVLVIEILRGRLRLSTSVVVASIMAIAGLLLLMGAPTPGATTPGATIAGIGLALVASASFAVISLVGAHPEPDYHDATGTALAFLLGGGLVLGVASLSGPITVPLTLPTAGGLLALGLIPSAFAYLAYLRGLRTETGTTGALIALLEPITATVLATTVLGEHLDLRAGLGALLLLVSVAATAVWSPSARSRPPEG